MLQTGLAAAFGFVSALFLVLLIAPAAARRISELTWRQATRVLPQSSEEIAAGRDHLRGLNAVDMRQLEMKLEAVCEKERLLRIGKQGFEKQISDLTSQSTQLQQKVSTLLAEHGQLSKDLRNAGENKALLTTEAADRDVRLASLSSDFSKLRNDHVRLTSALSSLEEARQLSENTIDLMRSEAIVLRSKLSTAESELRIARTESRRHENDLKLSNRKIGTIESKLERSIRNFAEAEEKLDRREAELKRLKETAKPAVSAIFNIEKSAPLAPQLNVRRQVTKVSAKSEEIVLQINRLRPALRVASAAVKLEQLRVKAEMMDIAGRVTAEAALHNSTLTNKINALQPGASRLSDAILMHSKNAAE